MARIYEVNFKLGASIASSFSSAFKNAKGAMDALKNSTGSFSQEANDIRALLRQQKAVETSSKRFDDLKQRAKVLRASIKELGPVTDENRATHERMTLQLSRLSREVSGARTRMQSEKTTLDQLNTSLNKAGLSTEQLKSRQADLARQAERTRAAQARLNAAVGARDASAARMGAARGRLVEAAGIAASLAAPIKLSMDWEQHLAELNKVADLTPDQLAGIADAAQDMAVKTGVAREEIIGAYTAAAQGGMAMDDWQQFSEVTSMMAVAFDELSGTDAGKMFMAWQAGMGLTVDEAQELASAVNHLGNQISNAAATDIGEVLQRQGGVLKAAGIQGADAAALAAAMLSGGASPEIAATASKNFASALSKGSAASTAQKSALAALGFGDPAALARQMQEAPREAIMSVLESMQNLSQEDQLGIMTRLFGSESIGAIAPLIGNLDNLKKAFNLVGDASDYSASLQAEFDAMGNTSTQNAKKFSEQIKVLATYFGDILKPALNGAIASAMPMLKWLATFIKENPKLVGTIVTVAGAIGALTVAILVGTYVFNAFKTAYLAGKVIILGVRAAIVSMTVAKNVETAATNVGTLATIRNSIANKAAAIWTGIKTGATWAATKAQWALNAAFIASPIGWVVLGIGALIAIGVVLYKNWDKISAWWSKVWTGIKESVSNAWQGIKDWFANLSLFESGKAIFQTLIDGLKSMGGALIDAVTGAFGKVRDMLPFSDAKTGPFAHLTASGAAIMETLGSGIEQAGGSALTKPFSAAAGLLMAGPRAIGEGLGALAGGGGISLTVNQTITINGASADIGAEAEAGARAGASGILEEVERMLERRRRLDF